MNMESDSLIKIYTDGACKHNPGEGGWGAFIEYNNEMLPPSHGVQNRWQNRIQ